MKRLISLFILITVCILGWYFFLKQSDYIYRFKVKTSPATIFYSISNWQKTNDSIQTTTIDSTLYTSISQKLDYNNNNYTLFWDIQAINDSVTKVNLGIKQPAKSAFNRFSAPFFNTEFKKTSKEIALNFIRKLELNLSTFKVKVVGESDSPSKECACVNAKTTLENKAQHMMRNYNYIADFVHENQLQPDGRPMVIINQFNKEKNTIDMDFCFPFKGAEKLPQNPDIFYRKLEAIPAIKADFNGNYMYSHHAWFQIYDYAENNAINLKQSVIEKFHNNPNFGGNALHWKTEVYIPIQ
ncbi:GyrI-like domain-containing protein [Joostella sp. CR20]|uniref:GyrI-like domain-containing protein n=1 Tax=Joostella sp. CR20 TaxID=2804312 RepID=UPI00313E08FE